MFVSCGETSSNPATFPFPALLVPYPNPVSYPVSRRGDADAPMGCPHQTALRSRHFVVSRRKGRGIRAPYSHPWHACALSCCTSTTRHGGGGAVPHAVPCGFPGMLPLHQAKLEEQLESTQHALVQKTTQVPALPSLHPTPGRGCSPWGGGRVRGCRHIPSQL